MDGIFISYRRDDTAGYAGRLYDRLVAHFGANRVFMDVEGIEPGVDFVKAIEQAVASCRVLIVMIGDEWTHATDAAGRRRLDDSNDFVRLETSAALKRDIRVVPVLVGGAAMPRAEELPAELQALTRRQAVEVHHKQWDASTQELIRTLERILGTAAGVSDARMTSSSSTSTPAARPAWMVPAAATLGVLMLIGGWSWLRPAPPEIAQGAPDRKAAGARATEPAVTAVSPPVPTPAAPTPAATPAATPAPTATPAPKPAPAIVAAAPAAPAVAPAPPVGATTPPSVAAAPAQRPAPPPVATAKVAASPPSVVEETAVAAKLRDTPAPAAGVTPPAASPPQQVAVATPTTARPAASGGLPVKGESWTYRTAGKWPSSPKRNFEVVVQAVTDGVIAEALAGEVRRSPGGKPGFVAWPEVGIEFSPYLGALGELSRLESQSGLATPDWESQWTQWYSQFKRIGQESVSVPAGTFNAHKFEVWSNRHATGTRMMAPSEPTRVHYYVWYASEVKRYVKMQRRVISATNVELESELFELVAQRAP